MTHIKNAHSFFSVVFSVVINCSLIAMNEDMKLVEISKAELPKLRELYKKDWPKFINGYHTIDTFIRWNDDSAEMRVYGLEGSWEKDGSFIARVRIFIES